MASRKKFRFLVDYCIAGEIFQYLKTRRKTEVISFRDAGLEQRATDNHVLDVASTKGAIVVTGDKRFTERYKPLCKHDGIIKFQMSNPAIRMRRLKCFLRAKERHQSWKGVTRIYTDRSETLTHGNTILEHSR